MHVLLCVLPPNAADFPLLGVASIAGALRELGHSITLLDANLELLHAHPAEEWRWRGDGWFSWSTPEDAWIADTARRVAEKSADVDVLCFSTGSAGKAYLRRSVHTVRALRPELPILVGGPGCFDRGEALAARSLGIDVCAGAGEEVVADWLAGIRQGRAARETRVLTGSTCRMDDLPMPELAIFSPDYARPGVMPIESSRGCVNHCAFCDDRRMWRGYRIKSIPRLRRDVAHCLRYGRHLSFADSLLNPTPERMFAIADALTPFARDEALSWEGMLECRGVDARLADALAASGCLDVFLGVESFDASFLRLLEKQAVSSEAPQAIRHLAGSGIRVSMGFIVAGPPLQDEDAFEKDLHRLESLAPCLHSVAINPLCIPTNSPLWKKGGELGLVFPEIAPWQFWHSGAGKKDVLQRFQWCERTMQMLRSCGVKTSYSGALMKNTEILDKLFGDSTA